MLFRSSIQTQNQLLTAGKRQAGVLGNSDGSYQDLRTGQSISQEEAAAKIKAAGLPPETLAAVTPKNSPSYTAAQQSVDQTTNTPSNIPPALATQPEQSPSGTGNAPPTGAGFSPAYLQDVANGSTSTALISQEQAQAALQWQSQNGGQYRTQPTNPVDNPTGYSQQYLQDVADGKVQRPLLTPEQAQAQLAASTGAADPANVPAADPAAQADVTAPATVNSSIQLQTPDGTLIFQNQAALRAWENDPQSVTFAQGPEGK